MLSLATLTEILSKDFSLTLDSDIDKCAKENCLIIPVLIWSGINLIVSLLAAALVTYLSVSICLSISLVTYLSLSHTCP